MPRGDKSSYTAKQKRQEQHIEEGFKRRGMGEKEAEQRAWKVENKISHGGRKSGSGRGRSEDRSVYHKGGKRGGSASAHRSKAERSASARKAARTRARSH